MGWFLGSSYEHVLGQAFGMVVRSWLLEPDRFLAVCCFLWWPSCPWALILVCMKRMYEVYLRCSWTLGSYWSKSRVTCSRSLCTYLRRNYTVVMFPSRNKRKAFSRLLLHGEWSLVNQLPLQLLSETLGYGCVNQAAPRKETIPENHA